MTGRLPEALETAFKQFSGLTRIPKEHLEALWFVAEEQAERHDPADVQEAARHALWARGDRVNGWEPGSFTESLMITWDRADTMNKVRLRTAFPLLTSAFELGRNGGDEAILAWGGIDDARARP
ncbi:hypothetical protein HOT31_gp102 [Microbacterium phage Hendrix]|uniref:Uncharacterized protein n=1 Tax=Microbacterium phage Hendrix TaxID=2182341 RepID=A0A2U8UUM4_9CAUD|nr:hypothetical protein HOT31_gp102 [Microbacterium phage Hendrix]AWN07773.1 hypothetical protein PBI_HENDRIX_102 [Microbacterium phage Hendrix]